VVDEGGEFLVRVFGLDAAHIEELP